MAPRNPKAVPPRDEPTGNPDSASARRSRSHTHVRTRAGTLQDEELFDLDAVSGSEDDSEPVRNDHGSDVNSTAERGDSPIRVNDPDAIALPKSAAGDIRHFFDRSGDKVVCKECRQVSLHSQLFSFLNRQLTTGRPSKRTRSIGHQRSMSIRRKRRLRLSVLTSKDTTSNST